MSKIEQIFSEAAAADKKLFLPYLCAGDPTLELTEKLVLEAEKNGADLLELGLPFSDPIADGPTVQKAVVRSLENGLKVENFFTMVERLRAQTELPLILMTYYNPVMKWGETKFLTAASKAGLDAILVVDLPPEEGLEFYQKASQAGLDTVLLATPTTSPERVAELSSLATGFIYYVMVTGVTGARKTYDEKLLNRLKLASEASRLPVVAGFGVSNYEMIEPYLEYVDGVVTGSAIIEKIENNLTSETAMIESVGSFIRKLSADLHRTGE